MIYLLILSTLAWSITEAQRSFGDSCPLVNPPLNLATGALDQLFDTVLRKLLVPKSTIVMDQTIELPQNTNISDIRVYQLDTIRRNCPIQLTTTDSLGCSQRGLTFKACFGADELRIELTISTKIPGFKKGQYIITLPVVNIRMTVDLFSSVSTDSTSSGDGPKQAVRIVEVKTETMDKMQIKAVKGNFLQRALSSVIPMVLNLISTPLLKRLDSNVLETLNDKLSQFRISPLFIPQSDLALPKQEEQEEVEDEKEEIEKEKNKRRRVPDSPMAAFRETNKLKRNSIA